MITQTRSRGFACLLLLATGLSEAQEQPIAHGGIYGEWPVDAALAADGSVVMVGFSTSWRADPDVVKGWILALDPDGDVAWDAVVDPPANATLLGIAPAPGGDWLVIGRAHTGSLPVEHHGWLARFRGTGELLWQHRVGGESAGGTLSDIDNGPESSFYIGGNMPDVGEPYIRPWLARVDDLGSTLWQGRLDVGFASRFAALTVTSDGGLAVLFLPGVSGFGDSALGLARLDADGNLLWSRLHGTVRRDDGLCLVEAADGGFFLGAGLRDADNVAGASVVKVDASGVGEWRWSFWGDAFQNTTSLVPLADGGVFVTIESGFVQPGSVLVRLQADGSRAWVRSHGADGRHDPARALPLPGGGYVLAGSTGHVWPAGGFSRDFALSRVDDEGFVDGGCWAAEPAFLESTEALMEQDLPVTLEPALVSVVPVAHVIDTAGAITTWEPCGLPLEVPGLRVGHDEGDLSLSWEPTRGAEWYEVHRGSLRAPPPLIYDHDTSLACDLTAREAQLGGAADEPGSFYYLVRARNIRGVGPIGFDSIGATRPSPDPGCP